jgi:hypothetical protein
MFLSHFTGVRFNVWISTKFTFLIFIIMVLLKLILLLGNLALVLSYSSLTASSALFFIFPTFLPFFASFAFDFQLFSIKRLVTFMHTARFFIFELTIIVFGDSAETKLVYSFIFHLGILINFIIKYAS